MEAPDRCCDCDSNNSNSSYYTNSTLKLKRESIFLASAIGQEWLGTLNKLKEEKDLIIANDLNCSKLIDVEEKLNKHISSRDALIDKANSDYESAIIEYSKNSSVRTVNEYTENEKSQLLESIFESIHERWRSCYNI
jgi:hypothetical protein